MEEQFFLIVHKILHGGGLLRVKGYLVYSATLNAATVLYKRHREFPGERPNTHERVEVSRKVHDEYLARGPVFTEDKPVFKEVV